MFIDLEEEPIEVTHPKDPSLVVLIRPLSSVEAAGVLGAFFHQGEAAIGAILVKLDEAKEALEKMVCGWRGMKDKDGNEVPFKPELIGKLVHGRTLDALAYFEDGKEGDLAAKHYFHNDIFAAALRPFAETEAGKA